MTEDDTYAAARGAQADHEYRELEAAFAATRNGLFELIAGSAMSETELREKAYVGLHVLDGVKSALLAVAGNKAVAQHADLIRNIMAGNDPG